jgi:hypothetical protein
VQYARLLAAEGFDEIQVRVARPAGNFAAVVAFYGATLGPPVIGFFEDHDGHDGVIFSLPDASRQHVQANSYGGKTYA